MLTNLLHHCDKNNISKHFHSIAVLVFSCNWYYVILKKIRRYIIKNLFCVQCIFTMFTYHFPWSITADLVQCTLTYIYKVHTIVSSLDDELLPRCLPLLQPIFSHNCVLTGDPDRKEVPADVRVSRDRMTSWHDSHIVALSWRLAL